MSFMRLVMDFLFDLPRYAKATSRLTKSPSSASMPSATAWACSLPDSSLLLLSF